MILLSVRESLILSMVDIERLNRQLQPIIDNINLSVKCDRNSSVDRVLYTLQDHDGAIVREFLLWRRYFLQTSSQA